MTAIRLSFAAAPTEPSLDNASTDAALIAELALTFDLDTLVSEGQIDPFRR